MRTFNYFEEIENEVAVEAPPIIYKYRTWADANHRDLLTDQQIYFSHPFDLNDPLDVRPETAFDQTEFFDENYYNILLSSLKEMNPDLHSEQQLNEAAKKQWESITRDPTIVITNLKDYNSVRDNFDRYGVFSTSINGLSEKIWEDYSNYHSGYCIGFHTVELCRNIKSGFGIVNYCDAPITYSFFNNQVDSDLDALYYKKESWKEEDEFRFITAGIGIYSERLQTFSVGAVAEIILGCYISDSDEQDIIEVVHSRYPEGFPIYKTFYKTDGTLDKRELNKNKKTTSL